MDRKSLCGHSIGGHGALLVALKSKKKGLTSKDIDDKDEVTKKMKAAGIDLEDRYESKQKKMRHTQHKLDVDRIGEWKSVSAFSPCCHVSKSPWGIKSFAHYFEKETEYVNWDPKLIVESGTFTN